MYWHIPINFLPLFTNCLRFRIVPEFPLSEVQLYLPLCQGWPPPAVDESWAWNLWIRRWLAGGRGRRRQGGREGRVWEGQIVMHFMTPWIYHEFEPNVSVQYHDRSTTVLSRLLVWPTKMCRYTLSEWVWTSAYSLRLFFRCMGYLLDSQTNRISKKTQNDTHNYMWPRTERVYKLNLCNQ